MIIYNSLSPIPYLPNSPIKKDGASVLSPQGYDDFFAGQASVITELIDGIEFVITSAKLYAKAPARANRSDWMLNLWENLRPRMWRHLHLHGVYVGENSEFRYPRQQLPSLFLVFAASDSDDPTMLYNWRDTVAIASDFGLSVVTIIGQGRWKTPDMVTSAARDWGTSGINPKGFVVRSTSQLSYSTISGGFVRIAKYVYPPRP